MKKTLILAVAILAVAAGVVIHRTIDERNSRPSPTASRSNSHSTTHTSSALPRVPAYQSADQVRNLKATLTPSQFVGKTRDSYRAAQEIPETLAQLPCYCHCDEGFGHKSLHSCFVDDHAAHCAVCVEEALLAYQLQKQQRLTPEQIRKVIIDKYSDNQL